MGKEFNGNPLPCEQLCKFLDTQQLPKFAGNIGFALIVNAVIYPLGRGCAITQTEITLFAACLSIVILHVEASRCQLQKVVGVGCKIGASLSGLIVKHESCQQQCAVPVCQFVQIPKNAASAPFRFPCQIVNDNNLCTCSHNIRFNGLQQFVKRHIFRNGLNNHVGLIPGRCLIMCEQ